MFTCGGLFEYMDAQTLKEEVYDYVGDFAVKNRELYYDLCSVRLGQVSHLTEIDDNFNSTPQNEKT